MGPIPDMELTDWNDVMAVNLTAAFMAAKAQIPAMRKNGGDSIVFTSPFVGCSNGSMPGTAAYAASKAGLNELVQSLMTDNQRMLEVSGHLGAVRTESARGGRFPSPPFRACCLGCRRETGC